MGPRSSQGHRLLLCSRMQSGPGNACWPPGSAWLFTPHSFLYEQSQLREGMGWLYNGSGKGPGNELFSAAGPVFAFATHGLDIDSAS